MWLIVDILIAIVSVIPGVRAGSPVANPGRPIRAARWSGSDGLIYGVIGFGVLMLAVIAPSCCGWPDNGTRSRCMGTDAVKRGRRRRENDRHARAFAAVPLLTSCRPWRLPGAPGRCAGSGDASVTISLNGRVLDRPQLLQTFDGGTLNHS